MSTQFCLICGDIKNRTTGLCNTMHSNEKDSILSDIITSRGVTDNRNNLVETMVNLVSGLTSSDCFFCSEKITSQVIIFKDRRYHSNCLTCSACSASCVKGNAANFVDFNDAPYCLNCAQSITKKNTKFSDKLGILMKVNMPEKNPIHIEECCQICKQKLSGNVLKVQDNLYHKACFRCSYCDIDLTHQRKPSVSYANEQICCGECIGNLRVGVTPTKSTKYVSDELCELNEMKHCEISHESPMPKPSTVSSSNLQKVEKSPQRVAQVNKLSKLGNEGHSGSTDDASQQLRTICSICYEVESGVDSEKCIKICDGESVSSTAFYAHRSCISKEQCLTLLKAPSTNGSSPEAMKKMLAHNPTCAACRTPVVGQRAFVQSDASVSGPKKYYHPSCLAQLSVCGGCGSQLDTSYTVINDLKMCTNCVLNILRMKTEKQARDKLRGVRDRYDGIRFGQVTGKVYHSSEMAKVRATIESAAKHNSDNE